MGKKSHDQEVPFCYRGFWQRRSRKSLVRVRKFWLGLCVLKFVLSKKETDSMAEAEIWTLVYPEFVVHAELWSGRHCACLISALFLLMIDCLRLI